jgi:arylsulfatase
MRDRKTHCVRRSGSSGIPLSLLSTRPLWAWTLAALMLAGSIACAPASSEPPRWNVVFLVVDTLRADHLQIYGYDRSTSPFLEEFSRSGIVFQEARSQAGCTFPSVNSYFTSRSPQIFLQTMKEIGWGIPGYMPTLAEMLYAVGYTTAAVSSSPIIRVNPGPQNPDGGFGAGFSEFDDSCEREPATCINDKAFEFIDRAAEPFFLYLHYFEPHDPYQPPPEHERVFAERGYEKSWVDDGSLLPIYHMLYTDGPAVEFTDQDLAHAMDLYDEEILYFDSQFKVLIERLRTDGLLDRTIIILTSDHGEEFLEHDDLFHCKDLMYDTIVKVPLIFWIPGLERSGSVDGLAHLLDIAPTILDYQGIDDSPYVLEGRSLRPLIEEGEPVHQYFFGAQRYSRTVSDGRFKLTLNIKTDEAELYDLRSDPQEQTNIILRRPRLVEELTGLLTAWLEAVENDVDPATRIELGDDAARRLRSLGYIH